MADEREILREQRIAGFAGEQRFSSYFSIVLLLLLKTNVQSINFMIIHGIYNCAHPRLNNKKNMTTVTEKACERGDRMMLVMRVMEVIGLGDGGGDRLTGLMKETIMTE